MILINVKWTPRPEHLDGWMDVVRDFTEATRAEPGNLFFEWSRGVEDPSRYYLVEGFADDGAEAHVTSAHFAEAIARFPAYLAETPQIISVQGVPAEGWGLMAEITP